MKWNAVPQGPEMQHGVTGTSIYTIQTATNCHLPNQSAKTAAVWFAKTLADFEINDIAAVPTKKSVGPTNSEEGRVPCRHVSDQTSTG